MTTGLLLVVALIVKSLSEKQSLGSLGRRLGERFAAVGRRPSLSGD